MTKKHFHIYTASITLAALLCATPALADRGGKHGHGNSRDDDRQEERYERRYDRDDRYERDRDRDRDRIGISLSFGGSHREVIQDYYGQEFRQGHCPPGLAKKGNGCQPPGQARKWQRGQPLPRDVQYYPLPSDLMRRLPPPPAGHEYVRVASDILMIAVGTAMVVDAIQDIGR